MEILATIEYEGFYIFGLVLIGAITMLLLLLLISSLVPILKKETSILK